MKKFITHIILFLAPILTGLILVEFCLRNIPNDYSYKCNYLNKHSNHVEVLFLGNSHIYYGINPEFIKTKSFNGAHISQSLNYDLAILEKYDGQWKNLKYIIIPIDYFSMYFILGTGIEKWRSKNYSIYYDINQNEYCWNNFEILNGKFNYNFFRLKNYFVKKQVQVTCNTLGFGTNYNSKNSKNLIETGKKAARKHTYFTENNLSFYKNEKTVESIIEFSKRHKFKLLFITCPAYKTYVENLDQKQLDNTIEAIKKLSSKTNNVNYYTFLTDSSFTNKDFFDAHHLNEIGAKKFTLKIDSIINHDR